MLFRSPAKMNALWRANRVAFALRAQWTRAFGDSSFGGSGNVNVICFMVLRVTESGQLRVFPVHFGFDNATPLAGSGHTPLDSFASR